MSRNFSPGSAYGLNNNEVILQPAPADGTGDNKPSSDAELVNNSLTTNEETVKVTTNVAHMDGEILSH